MAFRVEPSAQAKQDARDILAWVREQGAGETGLRWFRRMHEAMASLSEFPTRCALAPEDKDFPYEIRQLLYGSRQHRYRILFTVQGDVVIILHIRHGRRTALTH